MRLRRHSQPQLGRQGPCRHIPARFWRLGRRAMILNPSATVTPKTLSRPPRHRITSVGPELMLRPLVRLVLSRRVCGKVPSRSIGAVARRLGGSRRFANRNLARPALPESRAYEPGHSPRAENPYWIRRRRGQGRFPRAQSHRPAIRGRSATTLRVVPFRR
jgi:hypothetical protein